MSKREADDLRKSDSGKYVELSYKSMRTHVETMRRILEGSGFSFKSEGRILDFGCAAGRMTRYLKDLTEKYEIWGVDIT